jgi:ankyrin repeat protein
MLFFAFAADINVCGQLNLVKAIREENFEKANEIVDKSSAEDLNQIVKIKPGSTTNITCSLGEAVIIKDSILVKKILAKGANPNQVIFISPHFFTPLMKAAENNDLSIVKLLVAHGAEINYQLDKQEKEYMAGSEIGTTALHAAAKMNSAEVVDFLVKSGANVNIQNAEGKTPLMMATTYTPKMLQKEAALMNKAYYFSEIGKTIPNYRDSFLLATRNFNAICILLNNKADINLQDTAGNTALHHAILRFDKYTDTRTAIHQLLSYYPNVNLANAKGDTPLLLALRTDLGFESDLMIYLKANITDKNKVGEGMFDSLLESYRTNQFIRSDENLQLFVDNIKGLLKLGAKDDKSELLDWLSSVYFEGFLKYDLIELVRLSLDSGSDPNFIPCEKCGSTFDRFIKAYLEDSWNGRERFYSILELFIEHGATNIKNYDYR